MSKKIAQGLAALSEFVKTFGLIPGTAVFAISLARSGLGARGALFTSRGYDGRPVWLRSRSTDWRVFSQCGVKTGYELTRFPQGKFIAALYEGIIQDGNVPVIIDGGGNIGLTSRYFANTYPNAIVALIEPNPDNMQVARKNTAGLSSIRYYQCGLWGTNTELVPANADVGSDSFQFLEKMDGEPSAGIFARSVDSILADIPKGVPFIVKLDLEGAEKQVLDAPSEWVERSPVVLIEPHDWAHPGTHTIAGLLRNPTYQDADVLLTDDVICFVPTARQVAVGTAGFPGSGGRI